MSLPNPVTRKEQYLNEIATGEHTKPGYPVTREEMYLDAIAEGSGSGGTGYEVITGNPLEFDSPSPQMVGMKCDIEASQDMHGYEKPWAGGEGKNKLPLTVEGIKALNTDGTWSGNVYTINNCTVEILVDDANNVIGLDFNGTSSSYFYFALCDYVTWNGDFVISGLPTGADYGGYYGRLLYSDSTDTGVLSNDVSVSLSNKSGMYQVVVGSGVTVDFEYQPMIRTSGTSADFEPYSNICPISGVDTIDIDVAGGETYTIDLDGTRYGGTLDVTSGVLTLTHGEIASYDGETLPSTWISDRDEYQAGTTPTTGAQVVYELATPQTIQLTPTQVWAVQGGNTITVSVDGVEAEIHTSNYATLKDIEILYNIIKGG